MNLLHTYRTIELLMARLCESTQRIRLDRRRPPVGSSGDGPCGPAGGQRHRASGRNVSASQDEEVV